MRLNKKILQLEKKILKFKIIENFFKKLGYQKINFFFLRKKEPYIIIYELNKKHKRYLPYIKRNKRAFLICKIPWSFSKEKAVKSIKIDYANYEKKFPKHKIIFLCNYPKQLKLFKKFNITSILCNHNAFLDEDIFKILPNIKKQYDAIYDAKIAKFKRHELASKIKKICFITYFDKKDKKYINHIYELFKNAAWFNGTKKNYRRLNPGEVSEYTNKAKVGLCLSKEEGAMFASTQYLLCGLPVVSTKSIGGREVFFDKNFVEIAKDNPDSIKKSVDKLIRKNIDPEEIRKKTLKKIKNHRKNFIRLIQEIYNKENIHKNFEKEFERLFKNKMHYWHITKVRRIKN